MAHEEVKMLKIGQKVQNFTLFNQFNKEVCLADFKGKKVVIYFYPKDDTPGCTTQACAFKDAYKAFQDIDVAIIGISQDSIESHVRFADKYELPFILLADPYSEVISAFDAKGMLMAKRMTFVLDEEANIIKIFEKATPDTNAKEILDFLNNL